MPNSPSLFKKCTDSQRESGILSGNVRLFAALAAVLCCTPAAGLGQDDGDFHSCTINIGGGAAPAIGTETNSLNPGWNFHAGGGFAVTRPTQARRWSVFVTANFMFDQLGVKQSALLEAKNLNPTNIGLLQATSAVGKFYSTTLDPTLRFPLNASGSVGTYLFAGFGWFRRDLKFTGISGEGDLLQPANPLVFGNGGNSGAFDVGAGLNFKLPGRMSSFMFYAEARVIHGLAVNNATTLVPISAGLRF